MKRRKEREFALQVLYANEYNGSDIGTIITHFGDEHKKYATAFSKKLINICIEHRDELKSIIERHLINWHSTRIAVIDRLLLNLAIAELIYFEDIPPEVSLNETIEISKRFSTEKSGKFINGILDVVLKELKTEGLLKKSGRGLISTKNT
jgi:N utilization substance protein B